MLKPEKPIEKQSQFAYHVHKYLNNYVTLSDTKASILLAAAGILLAFIFPAIDIIWLGISTERLSPLIILFLRLLSAGFTVASAFFSLYSVYPRLKTSQKAGLIFWENIKSKKLEEYLKSIKKIDEGGILAQVVSHNYDLALVLKKKYTLVKSSTILFSTALVLLFVSLLIPPFL